MTEQKNRKPFWKT